MKILPPVSIEARRLLPSRWDLLAAVLVLAFIIAFADVSRFLVQPLSVVSGEHLSLSPALLPGYALRTALRMLIDTFELGVQPSTQPARQRALALASLCVGGMVLARAIEDQSLANELREATMAIALKLGQWT